MPDGRSSIAWSSRRGQGFIEVVDVEDQVAFRRGEKAKVGDMAVSAGLHPDTADGRGCQIMCHHRGRAAQKSKWVRQHAPKADGNQFRRPALARFLQDVDGIAPAGRGLPFDMCDARRLGAPGTALRNALAGGKCSGFSYKLAHHRSPMVGISVVRNQDKIGAGKYAMMNSARLR